MIYLYNLQAKSSPYTSTRIVYLQVCLVLARLAAAVMLLYLLSVVMVSTGIFENEYDYGYYYRTTSMTTQ